ncbi:MAG: hypothetical protein ABW199_06920 [Caulobacterales bacterium]
MYGQRIGDPCPKCSSLLIRRAKRIVARGGESGDVAYCARCNAAYELAHERENQPFAALRA